MNRESSTGSWSYMMAVAVAVAAGCAGDPAACENDPPFVVSSDPAVGAMVTLAGRSQVIAVTLGDQDVLDTLVLRWLVDYPGPLADRTHLLQVVESPATGVAERRAVRSPSTVPPFRGPPACTG